MDSGSIFKNGFLLGYELTFLAVLVLLLREGGRATPQIGLGGALIGMAVGVLFGGVAVGYCAVAGCR